MKDRNCLFRRKEALEVKFVYAEVGLLMEVELLLEMELLAEVMVG